MLLLANADLSLDSHGLERLEAELMDDAGMGSLYLPHPTKSREQRRFGRQVAHTEFTDEDGIVVSASLNVDQDGDLFELDVWKTDFSPVSDLPR